MRQVGLYFVTALVVLARPAWAQGMPLGSEFRVNSYTTSTQGYSSVAAAAAGTFVVVWRSDYQDGSSDGVFGQRYDSSGVPLGSEFRVNSYTTGYQGQASVASDGSGAFVVVWTSYAQDGSKFGVFGQRYDNSGGPLGPEFRVNTYTTDRQRGPSVAADTSGNFVVVWTSYYQDGSYGGVFGQRYANSGAPLGPEFSVNTFTPQFQWYPSVAADPSGNFVVAWSSDGQDGSYQGVFGQRYASSGAPLGPEFRVNTYTTLAQLAPQVAIDSSGSFVVVWQGSGTEDAGSGILGQRYDSSGAALGTEFRANTYTTLAQSAPHVAIDSAGNFVVVWHSNTQDGDALGIFGQRYLGSGIPLGQEFRVNTHTTNVQSFPSVGADPSGDFVVVWQGDGQDGSSTGIFGQRFGQIVPVELMRFGVE